jgi:hypothetical protein
MQADASPTSMITLRNGRVRRRNLSDSRALFRASSARLCVLLEVQKPCAAFAVFRPSCGSSQTSRSDGLGVEGQVRYAIMSFGGNLEAYLHEYIDGAGLANDPKAILFQTYSRSTGQLTGNPLPQANAYEMIQRRAKSAGITTRVGNHTFRATGVTAYLKNGGTLEKAAHDAAL